jgi:TPR repeat protein
VNTDQAHGESGEECTICLDFLSKGQVCTLPCEHKFHRNCVKELQKHGVLQVCPLCRAELPPGPEKLFESAIRKYLIIRHQVDTGKTSWRSLTSAQQSVMDELRGMLTTAANQGHIDAQCALGIIYRKGHVVSQDHKEAVRWTRKAAEQGRADAQFSLGSMYDEGQGVAKDRISAARWYRKAADQECVDAQAQLGIMFLFGRGVAQDHKQAARWTRKAADQGDLDAQVNLGVFYRDGNGVAVNHKAAVQWTRKAADQGHTVAQFHLSCMYRYVL